MQAEQQLMPEGWQEKLSVTLKVAIAWMGSPKEYTARLLSQLSLDGKQH